MDREELLNLRNEAMAKIESHRKVRFWLKAQFHAAGEYCLEMKERVPGGWDRLNDLMVRFNSLCPQYEDRMKSDLAWLGKYPYFPKACAELEMHIKAIEKVRQGMTDLWLDVKNALADRSL